MPLTDQHNGSPRTAPTLIAIEGVDGVGKTSVRRSLYMQLTAMGYEIVTVPSHCWLDRRAARMIGAAKYLAHELPGPTLIDAYLTDKQCLAERVIIPSLRTTTAICDRYLLSDMVYLSVMWNIPMDLIYREMLRRKLPFPQMTIMVEAEVKLSMERLHRRDGSKLDRWETVECQTTLCRAFQTASTLYSSLVGQLIMFDNSVAIESLDVRVERDLIQPITTYEQQRFAGSSGKRNQATQ